MTKLDTNAIRAELPATSATVYLNNGTYGPLPRRTGEVMAREAEHEVEAGRISGGMQSFLDYFEKMSKLRQAMANVVGANENEIAISRSTTEGVNLGLWGRSWSEGDEVVTTSQEHGGVLMPLGMLRHRYGAKVTFADIGNGEADRTLEAMEKAIHPGVKMVVLSHVLYTTGATLPLKEITEMAHNVGAVVHVDGAQSVGAIPVDFHDLGIDTYAFPGQKWLCGPDASGGFYVREDQIDGLIPTFTGFMTVDFRSYDATDPSTFVLNPSAARFETGTYFRPVISGLLSSVEWLSNEVKLENALDDIHELAAYCHQKASAISGANVLTPADQLSGLIALQIGDADVDAAVPYLAEAGISIRNIHENHALRISCGFYNTAEEIDRCLEKIEEFMHA